MCWSEIKPQVIRCSEIDPKKKGRVKKETVAARGVVKPEGLACDWLTKKVSHDFSEWQLNRKNLA